MLNKVRNLFFLKDLHSCHPERSVGTHLLPVKNNSCKNKKNLLERLIECFKVFISSFFDFVSIDTKWVPTPSLGMTFRSLRVVLRGSAGDRSFSVGNGNKEGFSLPEVLFGLFIGSMIALMLFESITQTNQVFARVTSLSSIERQASLMQQHLENDFSGMFSPRIVEVHESKEGGKKEGEKVEKKPEKEAEKKDEKSVFKSFVFEGTTQGLVNIMTFVTTNPLLSYKQPLPRIVRVAYRVLPDPENEGKMLLVRQQSEELSIKKFEEATKKETKKSDQTAIRSYEIARNLESIKFEFFIEKIEKKKDDKNKKPPVAGAAEEKKDDKKDKKDKEDEEKKPRAFILIDDWLKLSEEERNKFEVPEIPAFIHLSVAMNDDKKRLRTFEFWFAPCYGNTSCVEKGITSDVPDEGELFQRQLADEETKRMYMNHGVPQQGMGERR